MNEQGSNVRPVLQLDGTPLKMDNKPVMAGSAEELDWFIHLSEDDRLAYLEREKDREDVVLTYGGEVKAPRLQLANSRPVEYDGKIAVAGSILELRHLNAEQAKNYRETYVRGEYEKGRTVDGYEPEQEVRKDAEASGPILDRDGEPVQSEFTGNSIMKGTKEEIYWLAHQAPENMAEYMVRERSAGREVGVEFEGKPVTEDDVKAEIAEREAAARAAEAQAEPEPGKESEAQAGPDEKSGAGEPAGKEPAEEPAAEESVSSGPILNLAKQTVQSDFTGNAIQKGTKEELYWISQMEESDQELYLKRERDAGRTIDFVPGETFVSDKDIIDEIRKGPRPAPEPVPEADQEKGPILDLEGKIVQSPETGNAIQKNSPEERLWLNSLETEDQEKYLKRERDAGRTIDFEPGGAAGREPEPSKREGTVYEDMADYNEVTKEVPLEDGYVCYSDNGGQTYHYEGPLGNFEFDPKQFALAVVHVPESEFGPENESMALKYIGSEEDGRKIRVPEGIVDASYMFSETRITRAPQLPDSVRMARMTYMSCPVLKNASATLPSGLEDGMFMFADCQNLEKGPSRLPDAMQFANYMFADDAKLRKPPAIGGNMKAMDGAFAYCWRMEQEPKIPKGAQISAVDMTLGCAELDRRGLEKDSKKFERDRDRAVKSANKIGFFGHMASMCAAVAQFHAARQRGSNLVAAAWQVHKGRADGSLGRNWSDVGASLSKSAAKRSRYRAMSYKKEEDRAYHAREKIAAWDAMHSAGSKFTMKLGRMANDGKKDFRTDFFMRARNMPSTVLIGQMESRLGRTGIYQQKEQILQEMWGDSLPSHESRKTTVDFFLKQASENASYYGTGRQAIMQGCRGRVREEQLEGLEIVKQAINAPMIESMRSLQSTYEIFNDKDKLKINQLMQSMGYQEDVFKGMEAGTRTRVDLERSARTEILDTKSIAKQRQPDEAQKDGQEAPKPEQKPAEEPKPEQKDGQEAPKPEQKPAEEPKPVQSGQKPAPSEPAPAQPEQKHAPAPARPESGRSAGNDYEPAPMTNGEAFREMRDEALAAGSRAAKAAGDKAMAFFGRLRAAAAAAAAAALDRTPGEPVSVDDEAAREKPDTGTQFRGEAGKDAATREEQVRVDEAFSRDQQVATAERTQEERREAERRRKEVTGKFGDVVEKDDAARAAGDKDITD